MSKRAATATKEYLTSAPLPTYEGDTYTVIPHEFVINEAMKNLKDSGFEIKNELYRCNQNANIAQGIYHLNYAEDAEMGMMFAWSNSYDKSMRFKCAIGGYVFICSNGMINGDMGTWGRKHTGSADAETIETIQNQIKNAKNYYQQLVRDKEAMKTITVSEQLRAELVGRLYFQEEILNTEQLTLIKNQFHTPKYDYNADKNSLWCLYNHITLSMHKAHPKEWLDHQRMVHWFFTKEFGLKTLELPEEKLTEVTVETPTAVLHTASKQLDLVDQIAEIEAENKPTT